MVNELVGVAYIFCGTSSFLRDGGLFMNDRDGFIWRWVDLEF